MKTKLSERVTQLMQEYKGSERYYKTNRGYATIAAKLEDEGYEPLGIDNIIDEMDGQLVD